MNSQLCRMRDEAPFTFKEYDAQVNKFIFKKLWNEPFFDYMLVHTTQASAPTVSKRISNQLLNIDRLYINYNNTVEL